MGFGKWLAGAACAVGAVIAAPVVLPVLAATSVGVAVTGAVATAGATVAGAATAIGAAAASSAIGVAAAGAATAAGAALATAGTAIAGTAVGGAAIGALGAVGTGVAGAATAIGTATAGTALGAALTTVGAVAGTSTGAAALGAIATSSVVAAGNAASGAVKLSEAAGIKNDANARYTEKRDECGDIEDSTNLSLQNLGKLKLEIWNTFTRFTAMYEKVKNKPEFSGDASCERVTLPKDELANIRSIGLTVQDMLAGGIGSVSAGGLIGLATSSGLMSSITVASTGTAISSLSGAAAANATLAAFGGGALTAGGAGMAGGTIIMGGLTFAPMLMVGGIALNAHGKKNLKKAHEISAEANHAIENLEKVEVELQKVCTLSDQVYAELKKMQAVYLKFLSDAEELVCKKQDYLLFDDTEKKLFETAVLSLITVKSLSTQDILDQKDNGKVRTEEVSTAIEQTAKVRTSINEVA